MSLRKAIHKKCGNYGSDPFDARAAAQQMAHCISMDCSHHPVRRVTAKATLKPPLNAYHIASQQLDQRARDLLASNRIALGDGQIDLLLTLESISETRIS